LGFRYDMSVLDSWSFFDSSRNYGVGTLFPYRVDGLTILPNTIPFDDVPRFCGYAVSDIFSFWKPKLEWIARNEGLIMLNAHPDRWWSGSADAAAVFDRSIGYVLENFDPARLNAGGLAEHLNTQFARGALIALGDSPKLEIPRRRVPAMEFSEAKHNPMLTPPREFLVQRGAAGAGE